MIFKTRHEVRQLRSDVSELRDMLRSHFDIKYTMDDFRQWSESHPDAKEIPVSVGEFINFYKTLSPASRALYYRGSRLKPKVRKGENGK